MFIEEIKRQALQKQIAEQREDLEALQAFVLSGVIHATDAELAEATQALEDLEVELAALPPRTRH